MRQLLSFARYSIGLVAIALLAFGIPGVHAAPVSEPGVGQAGDHFFCVDILGARSGPFPTDTACSGVSQPGLEGRYFDWTIKNAQSSSGGPSGKLQVGQITFRHPKSQASINMLKSLVASENLTDVRFSFLEGEVGSATSYFHIEVRNAHIISDNQYLPDTAGDANAASVPLMEQVTLNFQSIREDANGASFQLGRFPNPT